MFTEEFAALILTCTGIVVPIVELLKKLLKITGAGAVLLSLIISAFISIPLGMMQHLATFENVVLVIAVFAVANGWYKVVHKSGGLQ